jgi:hypothetical protein
MSRGNRNFHLYLFVKNEALQEKIQLFAFLARIMPVGNSNCLCKGRSYGVVWMGLLRPQLIPRNLVHRKAGVPKLLPSYPALLNLI